MPRFRYRAMKSSTVGKEIVSGVYEANTTREARDYIKKLGLIPLDIQSDSGEEASKNVRESKGKKLRNLSLQERIDFTSTFKTLSRSGVPIVEAIIFMENNADNYKIKAVASELKRQILAGCTFADAVAKYPSVFGKIYIGLAKAGEDSGELEQTLDRLNELLQKQSNIKGKVIGTLIYPVFVIILAIFALAIMLMFVFPAFKDMFEALGDRLPIYTKICLDVGIFLKEYWLTLPIVAISGFCTVFYATRFEATLYFLDKFVLKIPMISNLIKYANLSTFFAVIQVTYDAGIPVINCIYLANLSVSNRIMRDAIGKAAVHVQKGLHLSQALKTTKMIPQMMLFLISVGEQTGRLGELMRQAAKFIDEKLDKIIDAITKMIEPLMLVVIGAMVLFLALSLYMPLFASYQV